ncbi:MAG: D-3-phosphoglycerate dehydrogenase [Frankiales bacterium]|nr:D-3-phosphoglycerate dehydrogenase [Frankiales bacterium]
MNEAHQAGADRWRVLALPPLPKDLLEGLFGDERAEIVVPAERTQQAVDALLPDVDLVVGDWTHTLRVNDPGPRLAMVQMPSVGVDTIDVDRCAAAGIPVANCAGANTVSVAEWCVSATFALLRKTVEADGAVRRGEWPQTSLGGRELAGSTVGIVGMGGIGQAVARMFGAFECQVQYWSRSRHDEAPASYVELDDLMATSDVIVLVIALGPETRALVDARRLGLVKPGALLINGGRGGLVDEPALIEALRQGTLAGAALDVYAVEPLPLDSPLRELAVVLSPHMAGSTGEAATRIVGQTAANLRRVFEGQPVQDVVNGVDAAVRRRS